MIAYEVEPRSIPKFRVFLPLIVGTTLAPTLIIGAFIPHIVVSASMDMMLMNEITIKSC